MFYEETDNEPGKEIEYKPSFLEFARSNVEIFELADKPFDYSEEMIELCWELMPNKSEFHSTYNVAMARAWVYYNIDSESFQEERYYRSASQSLRDRRGVCVDSSFLLATMASLYGFYSCIASVLVDYEGNSDPHACAYIRDEEKKIVLVDPSIQCGYNVPHRKVALYGIETAKNFYNQYCKSFNRCDERNFERHKMRFMSIDECIARMDAKRTDFKNPRVNKSLLDIIGSFLFG